MACYLTILSRVVVSFHPRISQRTISFFSFFSCSGKGDRRALGDSGTLNNRRKRIRARRDMEDSIDFDEDEPQEYQYDQMNKYVREAVLNHQ